jgi:hypothetical protein
MSSADALFDRAADWLDAQARSFRQAGDGWKGRLAEELADDADFLRKLKPSLVQARLRGDAPTGQKPGTPVPSSPRSAAPAAPGDAPPPSPSPSAHTEVRPPKRKKPSRGGPNPFVVAGAALAVGILAAKIIDWRGHAHPRG